MDPWILARWALVILIVIVIACAAVGIVVYTVRTIAEGRRVGRSTRE